MNFGLQNALRPGHANQSQHTLSEAAPAQNPSFACQLQKPLARSSIDLMIHMRCWTEALTQEAATGKQRRKAKPVWEHGVDKPGHLAMSSSVSRIHC